MALSCYPLPAGGLLALEALLIGLTDPATVLEELDTAFPVILLLIFMVAGVFFLKDLLLFIFMKLLINVKSKLMLSLLFSFVAAVLSAFLDALTVTAVVITVAAGFYNVYRHYERLQEVSPEESVRESAKSGDTDLESYDPNEDPSSDLTNFRQFLRSLMMHAAVGTALGGVTTMVGEPQNLLIAEIVGWEFIEFMIVMAPVSVPVLFVGIATCLILEVTGIFGYGGKMPERVYRVLSDFDKEESRNRTRLFKAKLVVSSISVLFLVIALTFHLAEVGIVGLGVIVLQTAMTGVTEEHRLGHAFEEALPFTALLSVFFVIVAVIESQHLFAPVISYVLSLNADIQPSIFYIANGVLSAISDNVFVASIYISEIEEALHSGVLDREQFELLAIAINTGTNIPSVLTPNGQAAFLFLLTSSLAPLIRLSYFKMVYMAIPYFITMGITGFLAVYFLL